MEKTPSELGELSQDERIALRELLTSANIPKNVHGSRLQDLSSIRPLFDYIVSPAYGLDTKNRIGFYLSGKGIERSTAFAHVAKMLVLSKCSVYFVNLHNLMSCLEDADKKTLLGRVDFLFVDEIQKQYKQSVGAVRPYAAFQFQEAEDLMLRRFHNGLVTNLSASVAKSQLDWWSVDFADTVAESLVTIGL